ncbi:hypothetical protein [Cellulosimicrobium funkei]|uniref:hypothetical protein n=1 Tax=Cellulosimicrobium funkei TaxID=264251 RepID=UPI0037DD55F3
MITVSKSDGPGVAVATIMLGVATLLAAGVAAGVVLAPERVPHSVRSPEAVATAPVSSQVFDDVRRVKVTPQVAQESPLSLADSGRVTASSCVPGGVIESGSSPATIDDRPVLALATSVPLWRDLAPGAKGDDVHALQAELARIGFPVRADAEYGNATKTAVTRLFRDAGVAKPSGDLPAASVLWLPASSVAVKECEAPLGAVAGDEPFVTVAGALSSLRLADSATDGAPGARVVRYGELTAPVGEGGVVTDPTFLEEVQRGPELAAWQRSEGSEPMTLEYVLAEPLDVAVVPPGALFALSGTSGCVVGDGVARPVTVVSSSLGQTLVTFDGAAPSIVDLTPQQGQSSCA